MGPDPKMMALRNTWYDAPDRAARRRVAEQIQLLAIEEPPLLPLGEFVPLAALRSGVTDVVQAAQTVFWGARKA